MISVRSVLHVVLPMALLSFLWWYHILLFSPFQSKVYYVTQTSFKLNYHPTSASPVQESQLNIALLNFIL